MLTGGVDHRLDGATALGHDDELNCLRVGNTSVSGECAGIVIQTVHTSLSNAVSELGAGCRWVPRSPLLTKCMPWLLRCMEPYVSISPSSTLPSTTYSAVNREAYQLSIQYLQPAVNQHSTQSHRRSECHLSELLQFAQRLFHVLP